MKKASFILFKISTIFGAIIAAILLATAPFLLVMGFSSHIHQMLVDSYNDGIITWPSFAHYTGNDPEVYAWLIQVYLMSIGFVCVIIGVASAIAAIIAVKARKEATRGLLIASIVVGALSVETMIVAGIFGLIALKREQPQE